MVMHLFIDKGLVEESEMRAKNFFRAVVQILNGRMGGARFKLDDGHWAVVIMCGGAEATYDKVELMLPSDGKYFFSPFMNVVHG